MDDKTRPLNKIKTRLTWIILLMFAWEAVAVSKVFPAELFPSLRTIFQALQASLVNGELVQQTLYSLLLITQGLVIGLILALFFSALSMASKIFWGLTDTLTALAHPLPGIALLPLIIIWFGTGTLSIMVIIVHSVVWPMLVNMLAGFKTMPVVYKDTASNLGVNNIQLIKDIMIPASLPYLLSGIRIGWARAWRALISAEMIFGAVGSKGGLGWYIFKQRVFMDTPGIFAGLLVIMLIGIIVEDLVFTVIENKTVRKWGMI